MFYFATFQWMDSSRIITSITKVDGDYSLKEGEIQISQQVHETLENSPYTYQIISNDSSYIETIDELKNISKPVSTSHLLMNVCTFLNSELNDLKYITSVDRIPSNLYDMRKHLIVDDDAFYVLSNSEVDLGGCFYYVEAYVSFVTLFTLKVRKSIKDAVEEKNSSLLDGSSAVDISDDAYIDEYKKGAKAKARNLLSTRLDSVSSLAFTRLVLINNILSSKGFVITDENREDMYLEIVNQDDPTLLETLSKYLDILDSIHPYVYYYDLYLTFLENIQDAESIEESKDYWHNYISHYFPSNL